MSGKRDDLEIVIGADLNGLAADLAKTRSMFSGLAKDIERMAPRSSDFAPRIDVGAFTRASNAVRSAGTSVRSMASELAGFGAKVAVAGGALVALEAGISGISGAFEQLKGSVVMAAEFEQNQIAFETMLGSAKEATRVMADLRKFAADTPFGSKEVTQSARQLLAYGFAAEELIPSLKTIGTLAAATSKPLGELVYNVGTTKVQGRAMQLDINQLTDKGIDVYPGLAKSLKVDQVAVRKLVEEGRVDWNIYKSVLEDLAKTRFSGLLEKQADSLKGSWEQLTDAFDRAKLKLGQVIAQEAGLRGAARDLEGFAGSVERALDSDRFRSGVRFVGDLAKGGAQIAYEFGRAATEIARINLDGLAHVSPELGRLAKDAQALVGSLQNLKFDKRLVASFGIGLFKSIALPIADLVDWAETDGKEFKKDIESFFLGPLRELRDTLRELRDEGATGWVFNRVATEGMKRDKAVERQRQIDYEWLKEHAGIDMPGTPVQVDYGRTVVTAGRDLPFFNPPRADEPHDQVLTRWRHLESTIWKARMLEGYGQKGFTPYREQLEKQRGEFLGPFHNDPGGHFAELKKQLDAGKIPARRADWVDIAPPSREGAEKLLSQRERRENRIAEFERMLFDNFDVEDVRGGFGKMFASIRNIDAGARTMSTGLSLSGLGPFGSIAAESPSGPKANDLYLPRSNQTPAHLVELASKLNEQFGAGGFETKLADLKAIFDKGMISGDVYGKARDASVREVADRLGFGQPSRLPDTVIAGSQEDARLLAQAMGGQAQKTTEDLLRDIRGFLESIARSNKNLEQAPAPRPVSVAPAGGG